MGQKPGSSVTLAGLKVAGRLPLLPANPRRPSFLPGANTELLARLSGSMALGYKQFTFPSDLDQRLAGGQRAVWEATISLLQCCPLQIQLLYSTPESS